MQKSTLLLVSFLMLYLASFCQSATRDDKEFRISTGFGLGSATENVSSIGTDLWIQFDYKLAKHFSIAMDFDGINYKQNGFYSDLPVKPNEMSVIDNNFSLLAKYHFSPTKKIKIELASGWTYCIRQTDYYKYFSITNQQEWFPNVSSSSDYRIPFVAELAYPIAHNLDITLRIKYNMNGQNGNTYSSGAGLSLKL